jgi:hypothetical protein
MGKAGYLLAMACPCRLIGRRDRDFVDRAVLSFGDLPIAYPIVFGRAARENERTPQDACARNVT